MYNEITLRKLLKDCIDDTLKSRKLGDWCYDAWFYYKEEEGKDQNPTKGFLDIIMQISSEWGLISLQYGFEGHFEKELLEHHLIKLEKLMNLEEEDLDKKDE
ncbi:MAG TPA: hypothetical protein VI564_04855 [Candidatus Nanoarchaeia archaeon]|nr:hypothetical protein [Candidatus Nanoarchaeia archaeon]